MKLIEKIKEKRRINIEKKMKKAFTGSAIILIILVGLFWPFAIWYWYSKQIIINQKI